VCPQVSRTRVWCQSDNQPNRDRSKSPTCYWPRLCGFSTTSNSRINQNPNCLINIYDLVALTKFGGDIATSGKDWAIKTWSPSNLKLSLSRSERQRAKNGRLSSLRLRHLRVRWVFQVLCGLDSLNCTCNAFFFFTLLEIECVVNCKAGFLSSI